MFKIDFSDPYSELERAKKYRGAEKKLNAFYIRCLRKVIRLCERFGEDIEVERRGLIKRRRELELEKRRINDQYRLLKNIKRELNGQRNSRR